MKLSFKLLLLIEAANSPTMGRIIKGAKELAKKQSKSTTPKVILPLVFSDLKKLKSDGFKAKDKRLIRSLDLDIDRLSKLMIKLNIQIPKGLDF